MLLSQTDMQSLLIKGLWLQRQRAHSLYCPQNYKKKTSKRKGKRVYTASCGSRRRLSKRSRKRIQWLWKERGGGRLQGYLERKEDFRKGKSSKGDLYFGKGVASAWT